MYYKYVSQKVFVLMLYKSLVIKCIPIFVCNVRKKAMLNIEIANKKLR